MFHRLAIREETDMKGNPSPFVWRWRWLIIPAAVLAICAGLWLGIVAVNEIIEP
jgi:hypothetical protein